MADLRTPDSGAILGMSSTGGFFLAVESWQSWWKSGVSTLLLLSAPAAGAQSTWYVDAANTPPGSGTRSDPYAAIQTAIDAPSTLDGDLVLVFPGVYAESIDYSGKTLRIESTDGPTATSIVADPGTSAVTVAGGEGPGSALVGFLVEQGEGTPHGAMMEPAGGGVYAVGSTLLVEGCELAENDVAMLGGGLYAEDADLTVTGCTVRANSSDNQSQRGGGIHVSGGAATISATVIRDNYGVQLPDSKLGGGLYASGATLTLNGVRFEENSANFGAGAYLVDCTTHATDTRFVINDAFVGAGAGLVVCGGSLVLTASEVVGNYSSTGGAGGIQVEGGAVVSLHETDVLWNRSEYDGGGAAVVSGGDLTAWLCAFRDNFSDVGSGGALHVQGGSTAELERCDLLRNHTDSDRVFGHGGATNGPATLVRCTLLENQAAGTGGACFGGTLRDCIVWDNSPGGLAGAATATYSDVQGGWPGTGNISADPELWSFASRPRLTGHSPCIDAGDPAGPTDPDGSPPDQGAHPWDAGHVPKPVVYCTPKLNSAGQLPRIGWTGTPTLTGPDDFVLNATDVVAGEYGFLLLSYAPNDLPYFGGTLCIAPPFLSSPLLTTNGGQMSFHLSHAFLFANAIELGVPVFAQFWYRDPGYPDLVGLTDALVFGVRVSLNVVK